MVAAHDEEESDDATHACADRCARRTTDAATVLNDQSTYLADREVKKRQSTSHLVRNATHDNNMHVRKYAPQHVSKCFTQLPWYRLNTDDLQRGGIGQRRIVYFVRTSIADLGACTHPILSPAPPLSFSTTIFDTSSSRSPLSLGNSSISA